MRRPTSPPPRHYYLDIRACAWRTVARVVPFSMLPVARRYFGFGFELVCIDPLYYTAILRILQFAFCMSCRTLYFGSIHARLVRVASMHDPNVVRVPGTPIQAAFDSCCSRALVRANKSCFVSTVELPKPVAIYRANRDEPRRFRYLLSTLAESLQLSKALNTQRIIGQKANTFRTGIACVSYRLLQDAYKHCNYAKKLLRHYGTL